MPRVSAPKPPKSHPKPFPIGARCTAPMEVLMRFVRRPEDARIEVTLWYCRVCHGMTSRSRKLRPGERMAPVPRAKDEFMRSMRRGLKYDAKRNRYRIDLRGLWAGKGKRWDITEEDIRQARREMWGDLVDRGPENYH